jgi:predicted permease
MIGMFAVFSGSRAMNNLLQELRYAARTLGKSVGFTSVAVLTLALAIGANTAIFSVVDGVLLRPAPFEQVERLMMVWETDRKSGTVREPASLPDYLDLKARSQTFEDMAGFHAGAVTLTGIQRDPARLPAIASTSEFLPMLGIDPVLGRTFTALETSPGGDRVALIAEGVWDRLYARKAEVLGQAIELDGIRHRIIGVVPDEADFGILQVLGSAAYGGGFADRGGRSEVAVWTPLQKSVDEWPRSTHPMFVVGRLAGNASAEAAQEEMTAIAADLEAFHSENAARGINVEPLTEVIFSEVRPALLLLLAAVGLVLLVASANVANLLLARASNRSREVAIRASLGADGRRLARQFLVEGLLLSLTGASVGVGIALVGTDLLLALAPADIPRLDDVGINARVLAATLGVSLLVGTGFGLVPTLRARRVDLQSALRSESGVAETGGRRMLLQSGLVIAELALAVVLVVGAGLLLKSFWQIHQVDPGFRAEGVLKAEFQLPASRYPVDFSVWPNLEEMHRFNAALLDRVQGLPGVESAAITIAHPMDRGYTNSFTVVGREAESSELPEISIRSVSPGYFDTVRLAVQKGRVFGTGDGTYEPAVAVINQAAAQLIFPDRDPLGQRISFWGTERRIIGIVANEKFHGLTAPAPMAVYTPIAQTPSVSGAESLLVRAGGGDIDVPGTSLTAAILEIDPQLAVFGVEPLGNTVGRSVAQQRFTMLLLGLFAAVAIVLAVIGIHGVLNYIVSRRTSEMGIRMALGASRADVVGLIANQTAKLAITGLVLGLVAALASTKLLGSLLFGVTATDPATLVAVVILVIAVSILATLLPARRATSIQPIEALRHE